ncbi:hypothetical protein [Burkholderia pyrrocinia]|uniref:hypothetical protein n=1 Tax=Burkholderia pyrrocinia TaxID=60550 RepID=UPI001BCEF853|nr:hypothetical protein [Burkholderia pyrrocinia]QVN18953.1 hypothetical protein JYG32_04235 [Burkholderia pyrrocinia]
MTRSRGYDTTHELGFIDLLASSSQGWDLLQNYLAAMRGYKTPFGTILRRTELDGIDAPRVIAYAERRLSEVRG